MKLVDDDGTVLETYADDTAFVVIEPGKQIVVSTLEREHKKLVPEQTRIAMAVSDFLSDQRNIQWLLSRYPQEHFHMQKNTKHRHN